MRDLLTKLRILRDLWASDYHHWKEEVWLKDLDTPYCCSGRDCGCYGATVREIYTPINREDKPRHE